MLPPHAVKVGGRDSPKNEIKHQQRRPGERTPDERRQSKRQGRTVRLVRKPQPNERIQRERRVADPRRAVVPVARPANVLGQAERRARDDRARRLEDEQLQRERAPVHRLLPRARVRRAPDPRCPVFVRLL